MLVALVAKPKTNWWDPNHRPMSDCLKFTHFLLEVSLGGEVMLACLYRRASLKEENRGAG